MSAIAPASNATSSRDPSLVERGPSYLLVKFKSAAARVSNESPLAMVLWSVLEQHFTYQLVLDMEGTACLDEVAVGQLMMLAQWIVAHRGTIRLCGLSAYDRDVLEQFGVEINLPVYADVGSAIFGGRSPRLPR